MEKLKTVLDNTRKTLDPGQVENVRKATHLRKGTC